MQEDLKLSALSSCAAVVVASSVGRSVGAEVGAGAGWLEVALVRLMQHSSHQPGDRIVRATARSQAQDSSFNLVTDLPPSSLTTTAHRMAIVVVRNEFKPFQPPSMGTLGMAMAEIAVRRGS